MIRHTFCNAMCILQSFNTDAKIVALMLVVKCDCKRFPISYGPWAEKTCLCGFVNNKGADQPAHPYSLISAFVIHILKSISKFITSEISLS